MSTYRTITVNAGFSGSTVGANSELTDNIIETASEQETRIGFNTESNYNFLMNQPQIEDVTLVGNKTFEELGLSATTLLEVEAIIQS